MRERDIILNKSIEDKRLDKRIILDVVKIICIKTSGCMQVGRHRRQAPEAGKDKHQHSHLC